MSPSCSSCEIIPKQMSGPREEAYDLQFSNLLIKINGRLVAFPLLRINLGSLSKFSIPCPSISHVPLLGQVASIPPPYYF